MIITGIPAHRRASSGDSPVGRSRSGFLRLWLVPSLAGVVGPMAEATNAAVERREARRPDRKGRKDASQASSACFASTQRVPRAAPRAFRRSAPPSPGGGGSRKRHYGAGRAPQNKRPAELWQ